jgi:hypothetical protein
MNNETVTTVVTTVANESKRRGRPVVENSARQMKLAVVAAKINSGETISRGRPSNPNSARQARLMAQEARKAAGIEVKVGRPKMAKTEQPVLN